MKPTVSQVMDDVLLLEQMVADEMAAPALFRSTNYWSMYSARFLPELRRVGLKDFRRRKNSILASFGATDLRLTPDHIPALYRWPFNCLSLSVQKRLILLCWPILYRNKRKRLLDSYLRITRLYGEKAGARSLGEFGSTLIGNPEEWFEDDGNLYTCLHLYYYLQYAYCCRFVAFDTVSTMVELGPGSGKQVEILKKFYPKLTFLLFDIAPQLYVCEQYLKAVYPEDVISYRDTRNMTTIPVKQSGKIFIFGAWQFPLVQNVAVDLFWNSASFQEMEPDVVANYLRYVSRVKYVYLREAIGGQWISPDPKVGGVLRKVTLKDYVNGLQGFRLLDISRSFEIGWNDFANLDYYDSVWENHGKPAMTCNQIVSNSQT